MESDDARTQYRDHLLHRLETQAHRPSTRRPGDPLALFVNDRRVGELRAAGAQATLHSRHAELIDSVQLRSEDGVLLGGLCAPEHGIKTVRITLGRETVDLEVRNHTQGGSVHAALSAVQPLWHRVGASLRDAARGAAHWHRTPAHATPTRMMALMQGLTVILLLALAVDRLTPETTPTGPAAPTVPAEAPWAASLAEVEKLEGRLAEVVRMQAEAIETMQTQQQHMTQLQRTLAKLSSAQESMASWVTTVRREMEQREKGLGREVDRMSRLLLSRTQTAEQELQAEIHSLTVANDRLSRERLDLERTNQELRQRLKSASVDGPKVTPSKTDGTEPSPRREGTAAMPLADARRGAEPPLLFWVTFQEGTTEDNIERFFRDVQARKGPALDGPQSVEMYTPETRDRLLEKIRQARIVKTVHVIDAR